MFQMSDRLMERPLEALNPTHKIAVVAFLCNELLTSKVISRWVKCSSILMIAILKIKINDSNCPELNR